MYEASFHPANEIKNFAQVFVTHGSMLETGKQW